MQLDKLHEVGARRGISARRGPRVYAFFLGLVAFVACFLPLTDHLGYEFSELIALTAGLFGAAPGIAAARITAERAARGEAGTATRAVWTSLRFGVGVLALPVAIVLLNAVRRPACDPLGGMALFAALAIPSAALSATLGCACGFLSPRRAPILVGAVFLVSLAWALRPLVYGPQVFVFHHLGGVYPGPIYDEAIRATPALWWFRLDTIFYAAACAATAAVAGPQRSLRPIASLVACGTAAVVLSLHAEDLHWQTSAGLVDFELGGRAETEHLIVHYPREKEEGELRLFLQDAEAQWRGARAFFGDGGQGGRIDVYVYRSPDEKRRLVGAAETSFTKPWLRQIHTNDAPLPHPILRHELVHAVGADVARGPWRVPGGLVPQMALIEGVAVAGDWPPGELTVHEETRAMKELGLLPDLSRLFRPGRFYAESGARAYTAAGSFVRWLWETRGAAFVRDVYAEKVPLGDVAALAGEHARFLDSLPLRPRAVALAEQRFSAPAIVRKRCVHEVAVLQREAAAMKDPVRAVGLWKRCAALEPDDPALLLALRRAQVAAKDLASARETEERALHHPKLSLPLRAQLLTGMGDAAWKAGDATRATELYDEAARLPQPEPADRALTLRRLSLRDPATWKPMRKLLADGDTGPDVLLGLRDLDLARPREGVFAYLLAKQLQNRGAWAECARYAADALRRGLPGEAFVQEALRMRGIAAWRMGEVAAARDAFTSLGKGAPPGRALEAQRWLERLAQSAP